MCDLSTGSRMLQIYSAYSQLILDGDLRGKGLHIGILYLLDDACLWLNPFIKSAQMLNDFVKSGWSVLG